MTHTESNDNLQMRNKVIVITGASDGIGKAAATGLKKMGASVIIVGRSPQKTRHLAKELNVPYYVADFAKFDEVRELGEKLKNTYPHIDVLINNAGGIFGKHEVTVDGYEKTMQVNHLAHFLLTHILLDTLMASKATIINTSSVAHRIFAKLDINDLNVERNYSANTAYGNAKLENILFTKELNRRYSNKGIAAVAFHPGNVTTNFANNSNSFLRFMYQTPLKHITGLIAPEKGADTAIWLASTTPKKAWEPGEYYVKRKIATVNTLANDEVLARSLWEQSERMVGVGSYHKQK